MSKDFGILSTGMREWRQARLHVIEMVGILGNKNPRFGRNRGPGVYCYGVAVAVRVADGTGVTRLIGTTSSWPG